MWEIQDRIMDCKYRWRDGSLHSNSVQRLFWALPKSKTRIRVCYPMTVSRAGRNCACRHSVQPTPEQSKGWFFSSWIWIKLLLVLHSYCICLHYCFICISQSRSVPIQRWSVLMAVGTSVILHFCLLWSWRRYYIAVSTALNQSLTNALHCSIQRTDLEEAVCGLTVLWDMINFSK